MNTRIEIGLLHSERIKEIKHRSETLTKILGLGGSFDGPFSKCIEKYTRALMEECQDILQQIEGHKQNRAAPCQGQEGA
jgi:hypothetical protein